MAWYQDLIKSISEVTGDVIDLALLRPLNLLFGLIVYILSFWTWFFWLIAVIVFSIGGLYVIVTALIMVFSIDKDPMKMFSNIGKNLMVFNIFLLQAMVEMTKIGLKVIGILVNAAVNLVPFT